MAGRLDLSVIDKCSMRNPTWFSLFIPTFQRARVLPIPFEKQGEEASKF